MSTRVTEPPVSFSSALDLLDRLRDLPRFEFWPDDIAMSDVDLVRHAPVVGHRQVSDVHLAALARRRGGRLVTLDRGLVEALHPDDRDVVLLVGA